MAGEKRQWKLVGDYPPPNGSFILLRETRPPWSHGKGRPYLSQSDYFEGLSPDLQWCEVEIPTEVADSPIDEQLDSEAADLREVFWLVDQPGRNGARWAGSTAKPAWRAVAERARELHAANPWRPMMELGDNHPRQVLIKRKNGVCAVATHTFREADAQCNREAWKEIG